MKIELEVADFIEAFKGMNNDEKQLFANAIKTDEVIINTVNEHLYDVCKARENIIKKREKLINLKKDCSLHVTKDDIEILKSYVDDYMDEIAFGNSDWNHSYSIALKCMELLVD